MTTLPKWISGRRFSQIARSRRRRLGTFEPLEDRRLLAIWISELHVNPLFGNNTTDQYVELRGPANSSIDAGTYLVVVDGDQPNRGEVHTLFDLSGLSFGSNGYLVLLEKASGYATSSQANVLTSTTDGFGGLPGNIFSDDSGISDNIDFIFSSNSFLLVTSATAPLLTDDIDGNNDGTPDGVYLNWTVLDSVAILDDFGTDASYAAITFRDGGSGSVLPGTTLVQMVHEASYVARIGESTGWAATDWVAGTTDERSHGSSKFRFTQGTFGTPEPKVFAGRDLDHIGAPNFFASIRGTVFDDADGDGIQDVGEAGQAGVVVTSDHDGNPATSEYVVRVEPNDFPLQSEMTNVIPNATLTTTDSDNSILGFVVRPQTVTSSSSNYVFAHEGVAFTPPTRKIRVEFYDPVRSVSIDVTGGGVYGRLEAFDRSGQSQGFVRTTKLVGNEIQRLTITHAQPDIAYALAWSDSDFMDSSPFGVFDNMSFLQHEYTTTTDSNGDYEFKLLPPGSYQVRYATAGSQIPTTPTSQTVTLTNTESVSNVNFGNKANSPPVIANQTFRVDENAANGTSVGTVVATETDPGQTIAYSIIGGTGMSAFSISPTTGLLKVTNSAALNFEAVTALTLTVQAKDDYGTPLSSSATITIELNDVNEAPVISTTALAVNENASVGTSVGTVLATDVDGNGISYSIAGGNTGGAFVISQTTGEITVASSIPLDTETRPHIDLSVRAMDDGSPQRSSTQTIRITIRDINESPSIPSQSFQINENSPLDTVVGTISVVDPDAGQSFQFVVSGGTGQSAFAIHPTSGAITVKNPSELDFETASSLTLAFDVTDNGAPKLGTSGTVTITILDQNDSPAVVAQSFSVDENSASGTIVGVVSASDQDAGQSLAFAITGGTGQGTFEIDATSGSITVTDGSGLDFEQAAGLTLAVEVMDNGNPAKATVATMTIDVWDINDAPSISNQQYSVAENSPIGTVVGVVVASDQDAGDSRTFAIVGGSGASIFAIDTNSGAITAVQVTPLDLESQSSFTLEVKVTDNANATNQATVMIALEDVNEFTPAIAAQSFSIAENSPADTIVGTVAATDADQGEVLTFEIVAGNSNDAFSIQADTGQIRVQSPQSLDHEAQATYTLTVRVTDNVAPVRSNSATVTIHIGDVNEFTPVLGAATFSIPESASAGTQVGVVTATDADSSQTLAYAITAGNNTNTFEIDAATGAIRVAVGAQLDFETTSSFQLSVSATDSGEPSRTATGTVTINVGDVNEFAPVVETRTFSIDENMPNGSVVGVIVGTDLDSSQSLSYAILSGNVQNTFQVNSSTGEIRVANSFALDHEFVSEFTLTIRATDNGSPARTGTGTVTINVRDINEAAPKLTYMQFIVPEGSPAGASLGIVTATDADSRQTMTYAITSGNVGDAFAIDATTGEVTVLTQEALNFESLRAYDLTIEVTDSGTPPRSDSLTYVVELSDVNEFAPVVSDLSISLAEVASAGSSIGSVVASDADTFQAVRFAITAGNIANAFRIDATTGAITVNVPSVLDHETTASYSLTIEATDNGSPARSGIGTVTVAITDVNEFDPTVPATTLHIAEDSLPGTNAGTVPVSDGDSNQSHVFAITAGNTGDAFAINRATGLITLADGKSLDHAASPMYTLSVLVSDSGVPARSVTAAITVLVDDVNGPPTAKINGPFTIDAGQPLVLDATGSGDVDAGDVLSFAWDLNADGVADVTTANVVTSVPWSQITTLGLGIGSHPIRLTVADNSNVTATASSSLTITDSLAFVTPEDGAAHEIRFGLVNGMLTVGNVSGISSSVSPTGIAQVAIQGSSQNDTLTIDYKSGNPIPPGGVAFNGGEGVDTFVIGGSDVHLNLTGAPSTRFTNIEAINIIGNSPNTLTVDANSVVAVTGASNTLTVISDGDDTVNLDSGWVLTGTSVEDGRFIRILKQGIATIHLNGPNDWHHPLNGLDVNNNGSVEPLDVLLIVNELNSPQFATTDRRLVDASGLAAFPGFFYDVTNDAFLSPLDALVIINFVNSRAVGEGESAAGEGDRTPKTILVPTFAFDNIPLSRRVESREPLSIASVATIAQGIDVIDNSQEASRPTSRPQIAQKLAVQTLDDLFAELDVVDLNDLLNDVRKH
jgi:hypothetical protein